MQMKAKSKEKRMLYESGLKGNIYWGFTGYYIGYIFLSLNTGSEILSYYSFKIDGRQLISRNLVC